MNQFKDDLVNTDPTSIKPDISQEDQDKYQQILDDYSQQLESNQKTKNISHHQIPPQDIVKLDSIEPVLPPQSQQPLADDLQPGLTQTEPIQAQPPISEITQDQSFDKPIKKRFDFFKYLFYISVIVFIVLLVLLVKDYLALQNIDNNLSSFVKPIPSVTSSPQTLSQDNCLLNDTSYQIGDTVSSQDDCNICTCQQTESGPQIICADTNCQQDEIN